MHLAHLISQFRRFAGKGNGVKQVRNFPYINDELKRCNRFVLYSTSPAGGIPLRRIMAELLIIVTNINLKRRVP